MESVSPDDDGRDQHPLYTLFSAPLEGINYSASTIGEKEIRIGFAVPAVNTRVGIRDCRSGESPSSLPSRFAPFFAPLYSRHFPRLFRRKRSLLSALFLLTFVEGGRPATTALPVIIRAIFPFRLLSFYILSPLPPLPL